MKPFKTALAVPRGVWEGCLGDEAIRKFLCCPRTVQQLRKKGIKKKCTKESSFITQQKQPLVETGRSFKMGPNEMRKGSPRVSEAPGDSVEVANSNHVYVYIYNKVQ